MSTIGRDDHFRAVMLEHDDDPDDLAELTTDDLDSPSRFLLVENNVRGSNPPHWYSTHDTPELAGSYHVDQEYREDWDPMGLWDLDTGERFDPRLGLSFESRRTN